MRRESIIKAKVMNGLQGARMLQLIDKLGTLSLENDSLHFQVAHSKAVIRMHSQEKYIHEKRVSEISLLKNEIKALQKRLSTKELQKIGLQHKLDEQGGDVKRLRRTLQAHSQDRAAALAAQAEASSANSRRSESKRKSETSDGNGDEYTINGLRAHVASLQAALVAKDQQQGAYEDQIKTMKKLHGRQTEELKLHLQSEHKLQQRQEKRERKAGMSLRV